MKPRQRSRVHLTLDEQRVLFNHRQDHEALSLSELGWWAQTQFKLWRATAPSSVSELLKRFRYHSALSAETPAEPPAPVSAVLDIKLAEWIEQCSKQRICLTGHLVRLKAKKLRDEIVANDLSVVMRERLLVLTFSKGWQYNFQRRLKLKSRRMHGEAGSASLTAVEQGRAQLRGVTVEYEAKNVFNMGETALHFCKLLPPAYRPSQSLAGKAARRE